MRVLQYVLLLVLAVELAVWEAFFTAARPFGTAVPLIALLAVLSNLVIGVLAGQVLGRPLGAAVPGVLWLAVVLTLGSEGPGGDSAVANTWRGVLFMIAGAASAAAAVGITTSRAATQAGDRATPEPLLRR